MNFETGRLDPKPLVYLSGAIASAEDKGARWRFEITPHLCGLGYEVFNPVLDQPRLSGISRDEIAKRKISDYASYQEACRKIVDIDLSVLKQSNLVICKLDEPALTSTGTAGELTLAYHLKIPILAWILPEVLDRLPNWLVGCIDNHSLFELDFYKLIPRADLLRSKQSFFETFLD